MSNRPTPTQVITDEVNARLSFNAAAYGNPWTGEYEDSVFVCAGVIRALEEAGYRIVEEAPDEQ